MFGFRDKKLEEYVEKIRNEVVNEINKLHDRVDDSDTKIFQLGKNTLDTKRMDGFGARIAALEAKVKNLENRLKRENE